MAQAYRRFFKNKSYTYAEVIGQYSYVKKMFKGTKLYVSKGAFYIEMELQPTENSLCYKIRLKGTFGRNNIDIFVINPKINRYQGNKKVPHLYSNGSLCLYYPPYEEWTYRDKWAETLIPWTSLWLYYYETWQQTGEWLGGGVH